jgi:hypothetical protein
MGNDDLAGVCGLYCGACYIYQAYQQWNQGALDYIAAHFGCNVDDLQCHGCGPGSEKCFNEGCEIRRCAVDRGIRFCYQCDGFPCDKLNLFAEALPHRSVIRQEQDSLAYKGSDLWLTDQQRRWMCQSCGAELCWYDLFCPGCKARTLIPYLDDKPGAGSSGIRRWLTERGGISG